MPHLRYNLDVAIPLTGTDQDALVSRLPAALRQPLTGPQLTAISTMDRWEVIRAVVQWLKGFAEVVVSPSGVQEDTVRTKQHICRHADGLPCDAEEEV